MNIKWLIQDVNLRYDELYKIGDALHALDYDFETIGIIPFTTTITNLENILDNDTVYILRGATKVLSILNDVNSVKEMNDAISPDVDNDVVMNRLRNAVFYDYDKFDQKTYSDVGLDLVNNDAKFYPIKTSLDMSFDEDKFIKPSSDMKAFVGGILEAGTTIKEFIESKQYQAFYIDEFALISSVRNINAEYRFFVVDGEIVTASQYKKGDRVVVSTQVPTQAFEFVEKCMKIYKPHDIYTIDVALMSEGGYNLVEYNCWNISGAYDCDLEATFKSVQNYMIKKYKKG